MATVNGVLSPPPQPSASPFDGANNDALLLSAKRKREESTEAQNNVNGVAESESPAQTAASIEESQSLVRDLVDVLKGASEPTPTTLRIPHISTPTDRTTRYDTIPSILAQPLPNRASSEPQAKRHKAEEGSETQNSTSSSITSRSSLNVYTGLDDILKDVDVAVSTLRERLQLPNGSELSTKISVFKKRAHELVDREKAFSARSKTSTSTNGSTHRVNGNGVKASTEISVTSNNSKTVLTLYGNAPGPKQLFSSFQAEDSEGEKKDLMQTLRRAPLPPGISTTDIVSMPHNNLVENKRNTFGDVFPTPPNVPALQPPKPSKVANTRSSTVGWYQPATADTQRRTANYFTQNVTPGVWLDYSNASAPQSARKKRERAMSLGGTKAPQVETDSAESDAAKLEAAFRSAYSGFAPTKDDSAAVAPTGVLDRIWWQKVGERNYERICETFEKNEANFTSALDPELVAKAEIDEDEELKQFEEMAENWESDTVDPTRLPVETRFEKSFEEKTLDEILECTSELLETLSSFQRKRHMSLNASNRPAGLLSAPDNTSLGTPTKPTDSEQNTYEIIKSQLKIMIENLPPYAVAKLNGDQLADLNISTKIEIQMDDYRGVLEEDELARGKVVNSGAIPRPAPPPLHRGSSSGLYGNQYSTARPPSATTHQYYGGASTPIRPPQNMPRAPSTAQVPYRAPAAAAPNYRPQGYGTPGSYQPHTARPQQYYQQAGATQHMQTPPSQSYMRPGNTGYQGVPQSAPPAPMNGRYAPQPTYPHQAHGQNGMDYTRYANGSNVPRQSSPQGPYVGQGNLQAAAQHHQPYPTQATPTPGLSQPRQTYVPPPATNGSTPQPGQPQYPQARSQPTGYSTFMTQEQQQLMVDRQRAQLANQQQARAAAQAAQAAIGSPATPTPQVNGGSAVAAGL
ncbi:hypothetical protein LSUE1_G008930 [Lachnellula suecica]|uniref:Uncharacterized protein n=1 Tax=Lachnellula suecica TaxID=602035 RepID=A0A8T9BXM4_9HELO|nr:hypothetical protein LSUE1_G008930 [Lachnellula suecica]